MIRVVHTGSRILKLTVSHPGSRIQGSKRYQIPDPGSGSATLLARHKYELHLHTQTEVAYRINVDWYLNELLQGLHGLALALVLQVHGPLLLLL